MNRLPSEITDIIAGHLGGGPDKADLQALSRCNKQLNASAYRTLWRSIEIELCLARDLRSASLEHERRWHHSIPEPPDFATWPKRQRRLHPLARLVNIASRPQIARHVKRLSLVAGSADRLLFRVCLTDEDNAAAFAASRNWVIDSPIVWRHTELVVKVMAAVLTNLCNLEQVLVSTNHSFYNTQMDRAAKAVLGHFSHPSRHGRLRSWHRLSQVSLDLKMYSEISMLEQAFCNLRELVIAFNGEYSDLPEPGPMDTLVITLLRRVNVPQVRLSLGMWEAPLEIPQTLLGAGLYVRESLEIFHFRQDGTPPAVEEPDLLDQTSTLRHVSLGHASISLEWLLHVLSCNAHSLRTVQLTDLTLISGTWAALFNFMAEKLSLLMEVTFQGLGYDPNGSSAHLHHESRTSQHVEDGVRLHTSASLDFQFLWVLEEVVAARSGRPFKPAMDRPVFGPRTRPYTLLDQWLGILPWTNIEDEE